MKIFITGATGFIGTYKQEGLLVLTTFILTS